MRKFQVTITDEDGESHSYLFKGADLYRVVGNVVGRMDQRGGFYGHRTGDAVSLAVDELLASAYPDSHWQVAP